MNEFTANQALAQATQRRAILSAQWLSLPPKRKSLTLLQTLAKIARAL